jgi:hypothetical protein
LSDGRRTQLNHTAIAGTKNNIPSECAVDHLL